MSPLTAATSEGEGRCLLPLNPSCLHVKTNVQHLVSEHLAPACRMTSGTLSSILLHFWLAYEKHAAETPYGDAQHLMRMHNTLWGCTTPCGDGWIWRINHHSHIQSLLLSIVTDVGPLLLMEAAQVHLIIFFVTSSLAEYGMSWYRLCSVCMLTVICVPCSFVFY